MGSGNSAQININLDRAVPFFYSGESVSGSVNVNITEGQIKVDEVFIVLKGEAGYTTTRTVSNSNGSTHTQTDYHTICFFSEKKVLDSPGLGKNELEYHSGKYAWRFDIPLTPHLPPTINESNKYPRVRYYLKFVIDKPWYKRNADETLYLTVFPHINLSSNPQCLAPSLFGDHNRKDVTVKGTIDKLGYVPGETITGKLEIENPRRILLKKLHLSLVQQSRIECNTHKVTIFEMILPTITNTRQEQIVERFSLAIPQTYVAPSYQFMGGFHHTANVNISYMLEFNVKIEGMFTNLNINIPITLGTESDANPNQHKLHDASNAYPNYVSYYPEIVEDPQYNPPSYSSVSQ
ncbi:unnamed protein product [Rotaria magnacalcarata]|uniref:Arrestin C-terminal-like domain-containing protein n=2 Tax=Rotaria magnacalcarata TaxID=392030 RepID=A0A815MWB9_9BILA|nr:unnamed protein product [Rotaria magnacalcarata]CAF1430075.1 unnamed protein product [Rotaria magnacalcarata]CAF3980936.1 unnamed protein product [Rotaria magnacalcarata]CAF4078859.1 unnamed protein product [Rotaria magnacalcarata]